MAKLIHIKPTSAGRRFMIKISRDALHKDRPYRALTTSAVKSGGRNNNGRLTVRHRGGGHKQLYRSIDFKRNKLGITGKLEKIEYDPKRTAYIGLVVYKDGERRYILMPQKLSVGDQILSDVHTPIKAGNCLPLKNIPLGTTIYGVELLPGKGAQLARSAGASATLVAREGKYATLKLPSSETRRVSVDCKASIGAASNPENNLKVLGKAGAARQRGRRPTVRGVAMNPVDHPLGGGEGKTSGGRHPVSFSGVREGARTRKNRRTNKFILEKRKRK